MTDIEGNLMDIRQGLEELARVLHWGSAILRNGARPHCAYCGATEGLETDAGLYRCKQVAACVVRENLIDSMEEMAKSGDRLVKIIQQYNALRPAPACGARIEQQKACDGEVR